MRILRFIVHSVLATKYYQIWSNIWSHSTVKFTKQVPPDAVKQKTLSKATVLISAKGPPPPKQQQLDFGAKQVSGGELKKLVGWYVVEQGSQTQVTWGLKWSLSGAGPHQVFHKKSFVKKNPIFSNVIINSSLTWMGSSEHEWFFWSALSWTWMELSYSIQVLLIN